ncbi:MAG: Lipoprotein signal peptidase [Thermoanaerobacterales bacterium 50_218]|nr:MAG: Lipoprotein signal peptidase [Thermoanaerobacterales bacterium 50_218]
MRTFFLISLSAFVGDQIFKALVVSYLKPGESLSLIPALLRLTYVKNPGGAFGILAHHNHFFIILSIVAVFLLLVFYWYFPKNFQISWGLGLLNGGILGNLVDRLRTGYVIDFVDLRVWPVFNFADVFIFIGTVLLLLGLFSLRSYERER